MSDNKLVKTIMDAATLTGLATSISWASKKVWKEDLTANLSTNVMTYVKFTAVMAISIAHKQYLEDKKIPPDSVGKIFLGNWTKKINIYYNEH